MVAVIRPAAASDIDDVVRLIIEHARFETASIKKQGLAKHLEQAISGDTPRLIIFVAKVDDQAVGYSSASKEFSTWAGRDYLHMDCLFVDSSMRGKNIGKLLFQSIEHYAAKISIDEIQWQTPDWNVSAHRFYSKIGAVSQTKWRYRYPVLKS